MELSIKLAKYNLEIQDINNNSSIENLAMRIELNNSRNNLNNIIEKVNIIDKHVITIIKCSFNWYNRFFRNSYFKRAL